MGAPSWRARLPERLLGDVSLRPARAPAGLPDARRARLVHGLTDGHPPGLSASTSTAATGT